MSGTALLLIFELIFGQACMHPSLIILHSARDDPSGGRYHAQIPQLDTPQASKESHNSIHNRLNLFYFRAAHRSHNFIVGLSNESPAVTAPTLRNYAVCGQYPGAVAAGATVYQRCDSCLPAYRYVIVQFEITDHANFCELEVYVRRKSISSLKKCNS